MIFSTVYTSTSSRPWERDELVSLLEESRRANAAIGVTGLLLYRDDAFMQVLEGEEETVRSLYHRIAVDPRHQDVANIWVAESPRRRFADWSMGFRDLGERGVDLDGHHDLLSEPLDLDRLARRDVVARLLAHLAPDPDGAAGPV